jgi:hypothetical protein
VTGPQTCIRLREANGFRLMHIAAPSISLQGGEP